MALNLTDFAKIWASTTPLTPYSFSESNYKEGWNFVGSTPPARQMWDSIQNLNDLKTEYLYNSINAGNPLTFTADDGNGNTASLIGQADGTFTWDGKRVHNGNATSVWSDFTPNELQAYAVFYDVGFAVVCHQWVGANVSHSANDLLFTIDADHLPIQDLRIPFIYSASAITGVIKIEASTGKVTVETVSNTSTAGRITIGGFMWVKAQALW